MKARSELRIVFVALAALAVALGLAVFAPPPAAVPNQTPPPGLRPLDVSALGPRVLVIAPHPDDETIGPGGLVHRLLARGAKVTVVLTTNGDGYRGAAAAALGTATADTPAGMQRFGAIRAAESRKAMATLGLPAGDLIFLGFPDGGTSSMWTTDWEDSHPHTGRNGASHDPYAFTLEPGAPYSGKQYVRELESIIASTDPTAIVLPDPNDENQDHWGANAFVQYALMATDRHPLLVDYLVHRTDYPLPSGLWPTLRLLPPRILWDIDAAWKSLPLSAEDADAKHQAMAEYRTQERAGDVFLDSFVRTNELFATYPSPVVRRRVRAVEPIGSGRDMPAVIVEDPVGDTAARRLIPAADISAAALSVGATSSVFSMRLVGLPSNAIRYEFHIRAGGRRGIRRYDIVASPRPGGGVTVSTFADTSDSLPINGPLTAGMWGHAIWVRLPATVLAGSDQALLAAETWRGPTPIDKTAWRRVQIRGRSSRYP